MRVERVRALRVALEKLIDSLQATVRVSPWVEAQSVPEPIHESASQLSARLGAAARIASKPFSGSPADAARVTSMCRSLRRLDAAYAAYRRRMERLATERDAAATSLEAEIDGVRADVGRW